MNWLSWVGLIFGGITVFWLAFVGIGLAVEMHRFERRKQDELRKIRNGSD